MKSPLAEAERQKLRATPRNTSTLRVRGVSRFENIWSGPDVTAGRPPRLPRTPPVTAKRSIRPARSWPPTASLPPTSVTRQMLLSAPLGSGSSITQKPANSVDRVRESLTFSRDKNFEREAVVDERALIRDGLRRGMGDITYAQVRGNLNARIASGEFQAVERPHMPGRQFTTAKTIAAEHEIIGRVRDGRNQIEPRATKIPGNRICRPTPAFEPHSAERCGRRAEFARPHSRHSGLRRLR